MSMTNEEITKTVENLKMIRKQFNKYEFTHSIDLAIKALEEQQTWEDMKVKGEEV